MRLILPLTIVSLTLAGCAVPVVSPVAVPPVIVAPGPAPVSSAERATATAIVNREMATRLPGVNVAPYTSCVINNATMAEIADLAAMGNSGGAASAVASIVTRPAATQCIAGIARIA